MNRLARQLILEGEIPDLGGWEDDLEPPGPSSIPQIAWSGASKNCFSVIFPSPGEARAFLRDMPTSRRPHSSARIEDGVEVVVRGSDLHAAAARQLHALLGPSWRRVAGTGEGRQS